MRFEVFIGERLVGWLEHDSTTNQFAFTYGADWLTAKDAFALSPNLPLIVATEQTAEAHSRAVRLFFENLLPEGKALDDVAATYSVSKHNISGLLVHLGQETAGALRIVLPGRKVETESLKRHISRAELSERIRNRPAQPFSVWDQKVRLSIAGFQDKIAVYQNATQEWFLVEGERLASTHLLKPEPTNPLMAGLTSNEFFCMRLAKAMKLPVAEVRLHHVPEPVLLVERFDRHVEGDRVIRLPAIDGCQALGLPAGSKYERPFGDSRDVRHIREGASYSMLFELLAHTARPAAERLTLLRWAIFQVLIGNTDAHAKNLTFMAGAESLSLAPAYDLLCGLIYTAEHIDGSYAMSIGDAFTPKELTAYEWAQFVVATRQTPNLVRSEVKALATLALKVLEQVQAETLAEGAQPVVISAVVAQVEVEAKRQLTISPGISKMVDVAK